jgi:hypothetical protein
MLAGKQLVKTSNDGQASTKKSKPYDIEIGGKTFRIHDTAGFDDGEDSQVPSITAVVQLFKLLKELDGVSLLVYCMRGRRVKDSAKINWKLFHHIICQEKVPIVAVITNLEEEKKRSDWWHRNKHIFHRHELHPDDVACITAIQGKGGAYKQEFLDSKSEVERLIKKHHLETPWHIEKLKWYKEVFDATVSGWFCLPWLAVKEEKQAMDVDEAIGDLVDGCGMTDAEAKIVAAAFEEVEAKNR